MTDAIGPESSPPGLARKLKLSKAERARRAEHMKKVHQPGSGAFNASRLKVDVILREEDRAAYEELLKHPATTAAAAHAWLRQRGYDVGETAVRKHRRYFTGCLTSVRQSARFADALGKLSDKHGGGYLSEVTLTRVQQVVMQKLFEVCGSHKDEEEQDRRIIDTDELRKMADIVTGAAVTRQKVEAMRLEFARRVREAVEAANKSAKQGDSGTAVADRVREMLGLPLWDSDEDWKYGVPEYEMETFEDVFTKERKDIDGRVLSPEEYDEKPPHRLKKPRLRYPPPKGIEPLDPPVPHPRSKVQLSAVPPVDRPIVQAIWEAREAKKAKTQEERPGQESQKHLPAPQDGEAPQGEVQ
jgi:hypothetical protein